MKKYFITLFTSLIIITYSCNKDNSYPNFSTGINPTDTTSQPSNLKNQRVKQSLKIHDDNVNGASLRKVNTIQEAVYFFYNTDNLLDSLAVFSDTTKAEMTKSMKLEYSPSEKRIKANFYQLQLGNYSMDFYYDNNNKLLKISTESEGKEYGIFYTYRKDTLTEIQMDYLHQNYSINLEYDKYSNLTNYDAYYTNKTSVHVLLDYDYSFIVDKTFDLKFANIEIKFLYEGGINVIHLMGLNLGIGNTHIITGRLETKLKNSTEVINKYKFEYSKDEYGRLIGRKVKYNEQAEAIYLYKY